MLHWNVHRRFGEEERKEKKPQTEPFVSTKEDFFFVLFLQSSPFLGSVTIYACGSVWSHYNRSNLERHLRRGIVWATHKCCIRYRNWNMDKIWPFVCLVRRLCSKNLHNRCSGTTRFNRNTCTLTRSCMLSVNHMAAAQRIKSCRYRSSDSVDVHIKTSEFVNDKKKTSSSAGRNVLFMRQIRGEWPGLLKKAALTQITTLYYCDEQNSMPAHATCRTVRLQPQKTALYFTRQPIWGYGRHMLTETDQKHHLVSPHPKSAAVQFPVVTTISLIIFLGSTNTSIPLNSSTQCAADWLTEWKSFR